MNSVAGVAGVSGDVPIASLKTALAINFDIAAGIAARVPQSRLINTSGLLTGGAALSGDLSLAVAAASKADFVNATENGKALTPKTVWDAAAPTVYTNPGATLTHNVAGGNFNCRISANANLAFTLEGINPGMTGDVEFTATGGSRTITMQVGSVAGNAYGMSAGRSWTVPSGETWAFGYRVQSVGGTPVIRWVVDKKIS